MPRPIVAAYLRHFTAFNVRVVHSRIFPFIDDSLRLVSRCGKKYIEITEAGKRALALEEAKAARLAGTKRRWDKRYRMVIFDIPERRRGVRERLRRLMHQCGFLGIQKSVWLSPYDCEELIALVKAELRIGKDALYVIVDSIENDSWIKKHFQLQ